MFKDKTNESPQTTGETKDEQIRELKEQVTIFRVAHVLAMKKLARMIHRMMITEQNYKWENETLTEAKISMLAAAGGGSSAWQNNWDGVADPTIWRELSNRAFPFECGAPPPLNRQSTPSFALECFIECMRKKARAGLFS